MKNMLKKSVILAGLLVLSNSLVLPSGPLSFTELKPAITLVDTAAPRLNPMSITSCLSSCIKPFFNSPLKSLISTSVLCGTLYGTFKCVKKYYERTQKFKKIEQWLCQTSQPAQGQKSKKFAYSGYLMQSYPNASDLLLEQNEVRKKIEHDLKAQKIQEKTFNTNFTNKELLKLVQQLYYISQFTPFPVMLHQKLKDTFIIQTDDASEHGFIMILSHAMVKNSEKDKSMKDLIVLEQEIETTRNELKNNSNLGNYIYKAPTSNNQDNDYTVSNNPLKWTIGNSQKATELYFKLLRRYMRLLAFDTIITNPQI